MPRLYRYMAWNGNQPGFASWNAVTTGTNPLQLSTNTGLYDYTTATSNTLQTEINNIVAGGTTSLWANYAAINNVDMAGYSLNNAKYVSTLDLQVSSINGADIKFNQDTVTVAGVTINNGTVNTTNITNNPAKGGGGGGGNNPTTGGSGNSTWSMINSAVGATMDTVSKTQQAISGVLNNTGAVLFQTYYAVETAGAIIDLANGAVQLATNAQALYDTREQNLIAGPGGPPGQTSYVYETINGTTQLQFSTLGTSVYTVFRTTDQVNPNQTFGREIFTSTIIPAGSKVIRSVSDPYQFNIISTCLLSTTNYMQSFGQWHAILEPDYNLNVSSLTANGISSLSLSTGSAYINSGVFGGISSLSLSTGRAFISSINGQPISAFLNTGDATFNSLSTNTISTAQITTSSLIVKGGLTFSTLSGYDITRTLTSTATTYDSVSTVTQNFLNYQMTLTSSPESFDMGSYFAITAGNEAFWSHKQLDFSQTLAGIGLLDITIGSYINGDYFDIKNIGSVNLLIYYSIETNNLLFTLSPGGFYRFTYSSSTNNWTYAANPTQTTQTTNNTFQITQGWNTTTLSTNNLLVMKASEIIIPGALTAQTGFINNITSQNAFLDTIFVNNATISSMIVSTSYTQNTIDTTVSTIKGDFDNIKANQITTSSISGCLFNSLISTIPTKTGIAGANQTLLNAYVGIYSPIPVLTLTQLYDFRDENYSYWNNNGFAGTSQFSTWFCALETLSVNPTAQVDFYIGDAVNIQISYPGTPTRQQVIIGNVASGLPQKVRFTFASGSWTFTYSFSGSTSLDNYNSLVINQNASQTSINTTDALVLSTSLFQIYGDTFLDSLIGQYANISTLSSVNVNTAQIKSANITTQALSTTSISTNTITANSITANSLNTTSFTTASGLTIPYLSTTNISTSIATAANLIALTRVTTPSISTLKVLNGFNARAINNPGNINIYQTAVTFGSGTGTLDIDTSPWVPGVYTASAVCRGNPFRTLEATFYYTNNTTQFCQNSQGFDNYNGVRWDAYPGYLRFVSQTDGPGDTFDVYMYLISGQYTAIGDDPPFPFPSSVTATTASVNTGTPTPIVIGLSTMTGSTITMQASQNFSILADFPPPTYISSGSITVAGTNQVSVLGNIIAIGAETDVDIQANTNNVNIVAGSNISLVADNYLYISSGSYMNTDVYGDMMTDLGGVYTVTSAEVINLNGSNGIGLNSSNAINLTASSNVTINTVTTIQIPGTASIPSVSPLALTNGGDYANNQNKSQIEFQYYGDGGFNHYISSRHDANVVYGSGNAIDFWLYSVYTGGDAQTASSAPGTGNVNSMSITASNVVINRPIQISDTLTGGTGTLTVDSGNHLYWNGTLIA